MRDGRYGAYVTPGDYFANGSAFVWPSLLGLLAIGLLFGWFLCASPVMRAILAIGVAVSLAFWLFVPNGWWAKSPPNWPSSNVPHSR